METRNTPKSNALKDRAAKAIAYGIIRVQSAIAERLGRWERRCGIRQKKILLLLWVCMGTGYCSYVLSGALSGKRQEAAPGIWDLGIPHSPHPLNPTDTADSVRIRRNQL